MKKISLLTLIGLINIVGLAMKTKALEHKVIDKYINKQMVEHIKKSTSSWTPYEVEENPLLERGDDFIKGTMNSKLFSVPHV